MDKKLEVDLREGTCAASPRYLAAWGANSIIELQRRSLLPIASRPSGGKTDMSSPGAYKWWEFKVDEVEADPWLQEVNRCLAYGMCLPFNMFNKCPFLHVTCFSPQCPKCTCCSLPKCTCCAVPSCCKPTGCRCVFPSTYLGVGITCPYAPCSLCPCGLTENEQLYWFKLEELEKEKIQQEPKKSMCATGCPCLPQSAMKKFGGGGSVGSSLGCCGGSGGKGGGSLDPDEREALFSLREIFKKEIAALPKPVAPAPKQDTMKAKPGSE